MSDYGLPSNKINWRNVAILVAALTAAGLIGAIFWCYATH
jgi:hypothetical protein